MCMCEGRDWVCMSVCLSIKRLGRGKGPCIDMYPPSIQINKVILL